MKWAFWRRSDADSDAGSVARSRARESAGRDADGDAAAALKVRARRRLIGAAALLLAAVVLVPMVLDPAPKPVADNIPIEIPSEKTPFSPRLPLPPDPAQVQSGPPPDASAPPDGKAAGDAASASKDGAKAAEPARPATKAEQKAERSDDGQRARALLEGKADSVVKGDKSGEKAGDKAGGFLLQVAALGSEKAATEMAARLKKDGLPAFVESVQVKDGARWRVRVGPFASRAIADKERARLRDAGFSANLVAPER
jgi:DedD protein